MMRQLPITQDVNSVKFCDAKPRSKNTAVFDDAVYSNRNSECMLTTQY